MDGCSEEKDKKEAQRVLLMVQCVLDTAMDQNGKKDLALARRHVNDALHLDLGYARRSSLPRVCKERLRAVI